MYNILLDFTHINSAKQGYDYLRQMLDLSSFCRNNANAVFHELLEISEPTQIYITYDSTKGYMLREFMREILMALRSAEKENPMIVVMVEDMK